MIVPAVVIAVGGYVGWYKLNHVFDFPLQCKDVDDKIRCVTDLAVGQKDPTICGALGAGTDDMCMGDVYGRLKDQSICQKIPKEGVRQNCEAYFINRTSPLSPLLDTSEWLTSHSFKSNLYISYPRDFMTSWDGGKVTLDHSWPLRHADPCDFKGDAPGLEKLTDFRAALEVVKSPMKEIVKKNEAESFVSEYFRNDRFALSEGFIEEFSVGTLRGYRITSGVEGCGRWRYYFPLDPNTTLVVDRDFGEFLSLTNLQATYGTNPSAILPDRADGIFNEILKSFYYYGSLIPSNKSAAYESSHVGVAFERPENLMVHENEEKYGAGSASFGMDEQSGAEFDDSFSFKFTAWRESYNIALSFDNFVRARQNGPSGLEGTRREITVAGYKSITFGSESINYGEKELNATYIYIPSRPGEVIGIRYQASTPDQREIINKTLTSFKVIK